MHGGWMQVFNMSHLLHAFNAWASGVYCAKPSVHCAHHSLGAEAKVDYQARQVSQCMGGIYSVYRKFAPHPNTNFSIHML